MSGDGDDLFAWQVQEPDGKWSMVGLLVGEIHTPLIHRNREVVERLMAEPARLHAQATGQPLRLVRFELAETLE